MLKIIWKEYNRLTETKLLTDKDTQELVYEGIQGCLKGLIMLKFNDNY